MARNRRNQSKADSDAGFGPTPLDRSGLRILHTAETALGGEGSSIESTCQVTGDHESTILLLNGQAHLISGSRHVRSFSYSGSGIESSLAHCQAEPKVFDEEIPGIVFFHSSFSLMPLMVLSMLRPKARTVCCAHSWAASQYHLNNPWIGRACAKVDGTLCGFAAKVFNVLRHELRLTTQRRYQGSHVRVENAVPDMRTKALAESERQRLSVFFVRCHDPQTGLDTLLEAFEQASETRQDLALHILGASDRDGNESFVLPESARRFGWIDPHAIDAWYASADVIVVPPRWEGFGLVVAEAFGNGTPALVSDRGSLPDLVTPGETGEVFELRVDALARTLRALWKRSLNALQTGRRHVYEDRFFLERFKKEITGIYESVVLDA